MRHTRRAVASFLGAQDAELRAEFFLQAAEPLEKGVHNRRSYGGAPTRVRAAARLGPATIPRAPGDAARTPELQRQRPDRGLARFKSSGTNGNAALPGWVLGLVSPWPA
jgi:hypothetical protein